MWFNLAATRQSAFAGYRDELAGKMSPARIAEAQRLAREWSRRSKRSGVTVSPRF
jgi:hypothetical protein